MSGDQHDGAPPRVYLQVWPHETRDNLDDTVWTSGEVTWSSDRVYESDVEYERAPAASAAPTTRELVVAQTPEADECLYINGRAWQARGEITVYACDICEYAGDGPVRIRMVQVETPLAGVTNPDTGEREEVIDWPDRLDELVRIEPEGGAA